MQCLFIGYLKNCKKGKSSDVLNVRIEFKKWVTKKSNSVLNLRRKFVRKTKCNQQHKNGKIELNVLFDGKHKILNYRQRTQLHHRLYSYVSTKKNAVYSLWVVWFTINWPSLFLFVGVSGEFSCSHVELQTNTQKNEHQHNRKTIKRIIIDATQMSHNTKSHFNVN